MASCDHIGVMNGKAVVLAPDDLHALTPGVSEEWTGAFETLRIYRGGGLFALDRHLARMRRALKLLGITSRVSGRDWRRAIRDVVEANGISHGRLRLMVRAKARQEEWIVTASRVSIPPERLREAGMSLCVTGFPRCRSRVSHVKTLDYRNYRVALEHARESGYDEALLVNTREEIMETATANIFVVRSGTLLTPPVATGCLNGITRQIVLETASALKIPRRSGNVFMKDVFAADEIFLTNSFVELIPVGTVENHVLPGAGERVLFERLRKAYGRLCRESREDIFQF